MLTKKPVREAERQPVLTFTLGDGIYALPIEEVIEVTAMVELIPLADAPPEILGMVNRHGEIMPVLDLRQVFKQPAPPPNSSTLFVVAALGDRRAGLVVDEIRQVEYLPLGLLYNTLASAKYIRAIMSYKDQLIQMIALSALVDPFLIARQQLVEGKM